MRKGLLSIVTQEEVKEEVKVHEELEVDLSCEIPSFTPENPVELSPISVDEALARLNAEFGDNRFEGMTDEQIMDYYLMGEDLAEV